MLIGALITPLNLFTTLSEQTVPLTSFMITLLVRAYIEGVTEGTWFYVGQFTLSLSCCLTLQSLNQMTFHKVCKREAKSGKITNPMSWTQKIFMLLSSSFPFSMGLLFSHIEISHNILSQMLLSINFIAVLGLFLL